MADTALPARYRLVSLLTIRSMINYPDRGFGLQRRTLAATPQACHDAGHE